MYPVCPPRVYGVGRAGLELARDAWQISFYHPRQKRNFPLEK